MKFYTKNMADFVSIFFDHDILFSKKNTKNHLWKSFFFRKEKSTITKKNHEPLPICKNILQLVKTDRLRGKKERKYSQL